MAPGCQSQHKLFQFYITGCSNILREKSDPLPVDIPKKRLLEDNS